MTTELLKYILRGAIRGIEEYEAMLEQKHVDPSGPMADMLRGVPDTPVAIKSQKGSKEAGKGSLDLADLLQEIK